MSEEIIAIQAPTDDSLEEGSFTVLLDPANKTHCYELNERRFFDLKISPHQFNETGSWDIYVVERDGEKTITEVMIVGLPENVVDGLKFHINQPFQVKLGNVFCSNGFLTLAPKESVRIKIASKKIPSSLVGKSIEGLGFGLGFFDTESLPAWAPEE